MDQPDSAPGPPQRPPPGGGVHRPAPPPPAQLAQVLHAKHRALQLWSHSLRAHVAATAPLRAGAAAALAAGRGGASDACSACTDSGAGSKGAAAPASASQLPLQEAALRSCVEQLDTLSSHFRALGLAECGAPSPAAAAAGAAAAPGARGAAEAADAGCDAPLGSVRAADWLAEELRRGGGAAATMRAAADGGPAFWAARCADFVRAAGVALFQCGPRAGARGGCGGGRGSSRGGGGGCCRGAG